MPPALNRIEALAELLRSRTPNQVEDPARKRAAVAIVLVADPGAVLLIRRAEREGDRWSGQMAFPGGRWSPGDPDLLTTARRETLEETGLDLGEARVLGALDDIAPRTQLLPPIIVRPYVFTTGAPARLIPNHEVAAAAWVHFEDLVRPGAYRSFEFETQGSKLLFPGYHLHHGVVWGMTERILTPLLGMLGLTPPSPEPRRPTNPV